jgi:hypothetical protein
VASAEAVVPAGAVGWDATRVPNALDSLGPEERRTVYSMHGLCVDALPEESLRVRGAFGEENLGGKS